MVSSTFSVWRLDISLCELKSARIMPLRQKDVIRGVKSRVWPRFCKALSELKQGSDLQCSSGCCYIPKM